MDMGTRQQPRKPAGTPVGGQFAPAAHDEVDIDLKPTITRSVGNVVGGFVVGGGHSGATAELDTAVDNAAKALRDSFGRDVEIRFNSDRKSGGAWLVTHPGHEWGNTWVGITAVQLPSREEAQRSRFASDTQAFREYVARCDGKVHLKVYISGEALRNPFEVMPDRSSRRTLLSEVGTVEEALSLINEKSVAGDPSEIERRKALEERFAARKAELKPEAEAKLAARLAAMASPEDKAEGTDRARRLHRRASKSEIEHSIAYVVMANDEQSFKRERDVIAKEMVDEESKLLDQFWSEVKSPSLRTI
jgi:hypothetical protein